MAVIQTMFICPPGYNSKSETPFFEAWVTYPKELVTSFEATKAFALKRLKGATKKRQREGVVVVKLPEGENGAGWYAATWAAFLEPHEEAWVVWRSDEPSTA